MSTPINHHYVSQCHIRSFFNDRDKKIYCYDKHLDNFYYKQTTKTLFSEEYSNTRNVNGTFDHQSLEDELNDYFENDFERHSKAIAAFAETPSDFNEEIMESIFYVISYGLISDVRFPSNKKIADDGVDTLLLETAMKIRLLGDEQQASQLEKFISESKKTKYSNVIDYTGVAARRLKAMGDLDFTIFRINTEEVFLLPDVGCILQRGRINNYINPYLQEVAIVGIPLTDKIFVSGCSKKVGNTSSGILTINDLDSEIVKELNSNIYDCAHKTVVTSDDIQLKEIIKGIRKTH